MAERSAGVEIVFDPIGNAVAAGGRQHEDGEQGDTEVFHRAGVVLVLLFFLGVEGTARPRVKRLSPIRMTAR
jgi:hypothetical protein